MCRCRGVFLLAGLALAWAVPAYGQPRFASEVTGLIYARDRTLIAASLDGMIRFWDCGQKRERIRVPAHDAGVNGIALARDGKRLASAGVDGKARVWDALTGAALLTFTGHRAEVTTVAFAPDGKSLVSADIDGVVLVWDGNTGRVLHTLNGRGNKVTSVVFSAGGKLLASSGVAPAGIGRGRRTMTQADHVKLWDATAGKLLYELPACGQTSVFSPDGRTLVCGGAYATASPIARGRPVFETGTHIIVWDLLRQHERWRLKDHGIGIALSCDGKFLASGCGTHLYQGRRFSSDEPVARGIDLWEMATGKEVLHLSVPGGSATVMALSPDGRELAAGQKDGQVHFLDLSPTDWKSDLKKAPRALRMGWELLASREPSLAYEAIWILAAAGNKTVDLLAEHVRPAPAPGPVVQKLVAGLDHKDFAVRSASTRELRKRGPDIEAILHKTLEGKITLELRRRVDRLLKDIEQNVSPNHLRQLRSIQVLERIGTREAAELLRTLAAGCADAPLTRDARSAWERLSAR